jgi:hypothetical protein
MEGAVTADIIRSMNETGEKIHEKIILPIHGLIVTRLFSKSIWDLDRDGIDAIQRRLSDLGLITISEDDASSRNTELGTELNVDLLEVFLGNMFEPEAVHILEKYGFLDEGRRESVFDDLEVALETKRGHTVMRPIVQKAYLDFLSRRGRLAPLTGAT